MKYFWERVCLLHGSWNTLVKDLCGSYFCMIVFIIIIKYINFFFFYCDSPSVLNHMHHCSMSIIPLWYLKNDQG